MELVVRTQLTLSWENVNGWIKPTRKLDSKKILDNASGTAKSGVLTAVVSPSGAGKTTLLAILSNRYKGIATGTIRVNGFQLSQQEMSYISGYVCQKEHNFEDLTVYEHMTFMARLKMDRHATRTDRHEYVLNIIKSLLLSHRLHAKIRSLSGGQKKRLILATQLLTKPKILFCDEPTTGLDSDSAERVVKLLRSLADEGKMVICSIHQPASGIFEIFDDVTLLASGGKMAYHGPVSLVKSHFSELGKTCPENFNLCEYIVSQVTIKNLPQDSTIEQEMQIKNSVDFYLQSKIHQCLKRDIKELMFSRQTVGLSLDTQKLKRDSLPFYTEFSWLFWRAMLLYKHSFKSSLVPFVAYVIVFLIISIPYHGIIKANQQGVQNLIGFLSIFLTQVVYSSLSSVVNAVPDEMPIFIKETTDGVYSPLAFYLSKICFMTVNIGIQEIIFMTFAFTVVDLNKTLYDYLIIATPTLLLSFSSCAYGFFLSTAFKSIGTYSLFSVPFEIVAFLLTGFQLKLDSLPAYVVWMKYLSFPYYGFESLNIIEWAKFNYIDCERASMDQCYLTGDAVLASLGFRQNHFRSDFIGLIFWTLAWHIMAFIALTHKIRIYAAY